MQRALSSSEPEKTPVTQPQASPKKVPEYEQCITPVSTQTKETPAAGIIDQVEEKPTPVLPQTTETSHPGLIQVKETPGPVPSQIKGTSSPALSQDKDITSTSPAQARETPSLSPPKATETPSHDQPQVKEIPSASPPQAEEKPITASPQVKDAPSPIPPEDTETPSHDPAHAKETPNPSPPQAKKEPIPASPQVKETPSHSPVQETETPSPAIPQIKETSSPAPLPAKEATISAPKLNGTSKVVDNKKEALISATDIEIVTIKGNEELLAKSTLEKGAMAHDETLHGVQPQNLETVPSMENVGKPSQDSPNNGTSIAKSVIPAAQSANQISGGLGSGSPKLQHSASNTTESVKGKMFGFGSSIFSSASTLITSAVQEDSHTTPPGSRKMSAPAQVSRKMSNTTDLFQKSTPPVSPKLVPSKDTKLPPVEKAEKEKNPEQPQQAPPSPSVQAKVDKAPSEPSTTEASQAVPKAGQSTCPLCKVGLNIGSKDPPNFNTCTDCKNTVCNQCGFNPMPTAVEVIKLKLFFNYYNNMYIFCTLLF